jgi:hypothetical protein
VVLGFWIFSRISSIDVRFVRSVLRLAGNMANRKEKETKQQKTNSVA